MPLPYSIGSQVKRVTSLISSEFGWSEIKASQELCSQHEIRSALVVASNIRGIHERILPVVGDNFSSTKSRIDFVHNLASLLDVVRVQGFSPCALFVGGDLMRLRRGVNPVHVVVMLEKNFDRAVVSLSHHRAISDRPSTIAQTQPATPVEVVQQAIDEFLSSLPEMGATLKLLYQGVSNDALKFEVFEAAGARLGSPVLDCDRLNPIFIAPTH